MPPTRYPVARPRRGDQYSAAHTARDGVALPLAHPFAPVGDGGPLAQLVGDRSCPARRDGPSCGAACGAIGRSSSCARRECGPAGRCGPLCRWLCRSRPGRGARVMMRPSICSGDQCRFPYQAGPPAPSAGDRPTRAGGGTAAPCAGSCRGRCTRPVAPHPARHRAVPPVRADLARHRGLVPADEPGDLAHPHTVLPVDHDVLALSEGKDDGIGGPWHSSRR